MADRTAVPVPIPAGHRPPVPSPRSADRGDGTPARPSGPPPRPELRPSSPAEGAEQVAVEAPGRPRALRGSLLAWLAAVAAAGVGIVAAVLDREHVRAKLAETASANSPGDPAAVVDDAVRATITIVLGLSVTVALFVLVWTLVLRSGRRWAVWALLATGLVGLFVVDLAQDLVSGGVEIDRIAFIAQAGLLVLGAALMLTPSALRFLREPPG